MKGGCSRRQGIGVAVVCGVAHVDNSSICAPTCLAVLGKGTVRCSSANDFFSHVLDNVGLLFSANSNLCDNGLTGASLGSRGPDGERFGAELV